MRQVSLTLCLVPGPGIQPYCGLLKILLLPTNLIKLIAQLVADFLQVKTDMIANGGC